MSFIDDLEGAYETFVDAMVEKYGPEILIAASKVEGFVINVAGAADRLPSELAVLRNDIRTHGIVSHQTVTDAGRALGDLETLAGAAIATVSAAATIVGLVQGGGALAIEGASIAAVRSGFRLAVNGIEGAIFGAGTATLGGATNQVSSIVQDVINAFRALTPTGFDGDKVTVGIYEPSVAPANLIGSGSATVTPGVTTFPDGSLTPGPAAGNVTHLITADAILSGDTMEFLFPTSEEGEQFPSTSFNGTVFQIANNDPGVTALSHLTTNIPGLTAADFAISDSGHTIAINFAGITLPTSVQPSFTASFSFGDPSTNAAAVISHTASTT